MINFDDVKNKTPALEDLLMQIAKELGAEEAEMFDGSVRNLAGSIKSLNSGPEEDVPPCDPYPPVKPYDDKSSEERKGA